jgi:hypothetical protein
MGYTASSGGTITSDGLYRVHTFTNTSGATLSLTGTGTLELHLVGGGGSGAQHYSGTPDGGFAGSYYHNVSVSGLTGNYTAVAGAGGPVPAQYYDGVNGSPATLSIYSAAGGAGGGGSSAGGGANPTGVPGTTIYGVEYGRGGNNYGGVGRPGVVIVKLLIIVQGTVTTQAATSLTINSAVGNGNITGLGGENATVRGFEYGTTGSYGSTASDSGSFTTGAFTKSITGLASGTLYYARAFATNSAGTFYGSQITFTTVASGWSQSKCGGVSAASISKVAGVTRANCGKIAGK